MISRRFCYCSPPPLSPAPVLSVLRFRSREKNNLQPRRLRSSDGSIFYPQLTSGRNEAMIERRRSYSGEGRKESSIFYCRFFMLFRAAWLSAVGSSGAIQALPFGHEQSKHERYVDHSINRRRAYHIYEASRTVALTASVVGSAKILDLLPELAHCLSLFMFAG